MKIKNIVRLLAVGVVSLVGLTAGRAADAQTLYVYANCRVSPCNIGVAHRYYAIPNNARYREGWRKISRRYFSRNKAWRYACRLHYARNRYRSPDIARGRINCAALGRAGTRPGNARAAYVYANCRYRPCNIGVANQYYSVPTNARYREGWRKVSRRFFSRAEAWRYACRLHYARNRYRSPEIASGQITCASTGTVRPRPSTNWVRGCGRFRYSGLVRRLYVPQDRTRYGTCREWGRWSGGSYAGYRNLPRGTFWVWRAPYWYMYRYRAR